jgi:hypothetical protein
LINKLESTDFFELKDFKEKINDAFVFLKSEANIGNVKLKILIDKIRIFT